MGKTEPKRGGIYVRMSKSKGEAKWQAQVSMCQKLAKAHNIETDEQRIYVDDGLSGFVAGVERPGWDQLLADVEAGKIDVLLAQSEDRLTRQVGQKETLMLTCVAGGVTWLTVNDGMVNPATADGAFFSTLRAGLARMESQRKSERQRDANDEHAAKGLPVRGGVRPFGYAPDKVNLATEVVAVLDDGTKVTEADLIRQAYADLISEDRTLSAIRTDWNRLGVTTVNGKPWDLPKVEKVLRRPRNAGYVEHRTRDGGGILTGENGEPIEGKWQTLVDRDTYAAAMAILNNPKRRLSKVNPAKHLSSSIAKCGACGTSMRVAGKGNEGVTYRCGVHDGAGHKEPGVRHVSIPCAQLDEVVRNAVVSAVMFAPQGMPDPDTAALTDLHVTLNKVRTAEARLLDLVEAEVYSVAEIGAKRAALRKQAEDAEEAIAAIAHRNARASLLVEAQASLWSGKTVSIEEAAEVKKQIGEKFDALKLEQRRALVRGLVEVTVMRGRGPGRVKIKHLVATSLNDEDEDAA